MDKQKIDRIIHLLGYASGLAGVDPQCGKGPLLLQQSKALEKLSSANIHFKWDIVLKPSLSTIATHESKHQEIQKLCHSLALNVSERVRQKEFFIVYGGDHSSAIGTWSGVYDALYEQGPFGLIWFDAHMDSHIPKTSMSGRLHGMPLACLLGHGDTAYTHLLHQAPKLRPQRVCLIGVRSYEEGEAKLLEQLKVRIFFIEEVKKRGLSAVFDEALQMVAQGTVGYGISLDVDSIDPQQAPGVDVPEPNGLVVEDLIDVMDKVAQDARFLGAEIVEFDPSMDAQHITEKAIIKLTAAMTGVNKIYAQR